MAGKKFVNYQFVRKTAGWEVHLRRVVDSRGMANWANNPLMQLKATVDTSYITPAYRKYTADIADTGKWCRRYWQYFHEELEKEVGDDSTGTPSGSG